MSRAPLRSHFGLIRSRHLSGIYHVWRWTWSSALTSVSTLLSRCPRNISAPVRLRRCPLYCSLPPLVRRILFVHARKFLRGGQSCRTVQLSSCYIPGIYFVTCTYRGMDLNTTCTVLRVWYSSTNIGGTIDSKIMSYLLGAVRNHFYSRL